VTLKDVSTYEFDPRLFPDQARSYSSKLIEHALGY
jgi:hypothetical protein